MKSATTSPSAMASPPPRKLPTAPSFDGSQEPTAPPYLPMAMEVADTIEVVAVHCHTPKAESHTGSTGTGSSSRYPPSGRQTPLMEEEDDEDEDFLRSKYWAAGLFDCLDVFMPNCCMSCFCPCVALAQVSYRVSFFKSYSTALVVYLVLFVVCSASSFGPDWPCADGDCSNPLALLIFTVYVVSWLSLSWIVASLRGSIRRRCKIPGDACGDCFLSCCCMCCVAAQMATHVKSYKPGGCSFSAPPTQLPAFEE